MKMKNLLVVTHTRIYIAVPDEDAKEASARGAIKIAPEEMKLNNALSQVQLTPGFSAWYFIDQNPILFAKWSYITCEVIHEYGDNSTMEFDDGHNYDAHEYADYDFNPNPLEHMKFINVRTINGPDDHTGKREYFIKNDDGTETIRKTELVAKDKEPMMPDEVKTEKEKEEDELWNICRTFLGKKN